MTPIQRRDSSTRLFIAGATGAIGQRLTPLLLDAGYDVFALTRDPAEARDLEHRGVHAIVGDVFDPPVNRADGGACLY